MVDGKQKSLLVHRKGSTRAFPPHHPLIPVDYQVRGCGSLRGCGYRTCGAFHCACAANRTTSSDWRYHGNVQVRAVTDVLVIPGVHSCWGDMVCVMSALFTRISCLSYVLTGTDQGFQETFGSTCHGAVSVCVCVLNLGRDCE